MSEPLLLKVTRYRASSFRGVWRTSLANSVVTPVVFLAAMGIGVGGYVDDNGTLAGVEYLVYLAPGLLAATAMNVAVSEATFPVFGSVHWDNVAFGQISTPLSPAEIAFGQLVWAALRVMVASAIFVAVMLVFGAVESPWVILTIPAAVLLGLAFAAPITGWSIGLKKMTWFPSLSRFVIAPMFLFSGTFFPVSQLPAAFRPVAYFTPLWHGVRLCRSLALGDDVVSWANLGHVGVLSAVSVVGAFIAVRNYRKKLML